MPSIVLTENQLGWLNRERHTARLVRECYLAYIRGKRPTADRLRALCSLTWITTGEDNTRAVILPALQALSGKPIAVCDFFDLSRNLAMAGVVPSIVALTRHPSGFVNFYNAFRNSCIDWLGSRTAAVLDLFERAYFLKTDEEAREIYASIDRFTGIDRKGGGGQLPPENIMTPTIACLDPRRRCPVINGRVEVQRKLEARGVKHEHLREQAWAFIKLIHQGGIDDAFMLDMVTAEQLSELRVPPSNPPVLTKSRSADSSKQLVEKDENEVAALKKSLQLSYVMRHNSMTNILKATCEAHGKRVLEGSGKDCLYDALIKDYDDQGRDLLIEAKSSTDVAFCRMAVGQLLDYRRQMPTNATTDLAVLFNDEPGSHILDFLGHVGIRALWFDGGGIVDSSGSTLFE